MPFLDVGFPLVSGLEQCHASTESLYRTGSCVLDYTEIEEAPTDSSLKPVSFKAQPVAHRASSTTGPSSPSNPSNPSDPHPGGMATNSSLQSGSSRNTLRSFGTALDSVQAGVDSEGCGRRSSKNGTPTG